MSNNTEETTDIDVNVLLRRLWKERQGVDIDETLRKIKKYPPHGEGAQLITMVATILLCLFTFACASINTATGRNVVDQDIITKNNFIWFLAAEIVLGVMCFVGQMIAYTKVTLLNEILCAYNSHASTLYEALKEFKISIFESKDSLQAAVRSLLISYAQSIRLTEDKHNLEFQHDEQGRSSRIVYFREKFKTIYNAAQSFNLTESDWKPYFTEVANTFDHKS